MTYKTSICSTSTIQIRWFIKKKIYKIRFGLDTFTYIHTQAHKKSIAASFSFLNWQNLLKKLCPKHKEYLIQTHAKTPEHHRREA